MSSRLDTIYALRQAANLLALVDVPAPKAVNLYSGSTGFSWDADDEEAAEAIRAALSRWQLTWATHRYAAPDRNSDLILAGYDREWEVSAMISVPAEAAVAVAS